MSWRSTARWALAVWLGFVLWMAVIEALPWGRSQSVLVAEEGVLFGATVFLLPCLAWRMFQPVRTEATAALDGFVRRGDLPPDDETFDALTEHVVAVRQQRLPFRYAAVGPLPGLAVLVVAASTRTNGARLSLALADALFWLCWAVALHQREQQAEVHGVAARQARRIEPPALAWPAVPTVRVAEVPHVEFQPQSRSGPRQDWASMRASASSTEPAGSGNG